MKNKLLFTNFFNFVKTFDIFFLFETFVLKDNYELFEGLFKEYEIKWIEAIKTNKFGRASGGCIYGFRKLYKDFVKIPKHHKNIPCSL